MTESYREAVSFNVQMKRALSEVRTLSWTCTPGGPSTSDKAH
jgi:hypothetical protein